MKHIVDYLAQEIKREATKTRKEGKHERIAGLLKDLRGVVVLR
jgi:hypothetical protein